MTIRSTALALAMIAGTMLGACETERTRHPADTGPVEAVTAAPQPGDEAVALTGFGMHIGSYEQAEGLSETWTTPEQAFAQTLYYDPDPFITGEHIEAFSESRDANGNPAVGLRLTDEGAELLRATTTDRIGEPIVLTVDGEVVSAPTVQSVISRVAQVSGGGEAAWIERLETILAEAGAEEVDRLTEQALEQEMPGFQVYVASTAPSETYWGEFPLLESSTLWMNMDPILEDEHVASVERSRDTNGKPAIGITLTEAGAKVMRERADEYVDRYLVIAWEGRAVAAPRAMTPLGEKLMVTGAGLDPELPEDWVSQLMDRHGG